MTLSGAKYFFTKISFTLVARRPHASTFTLRKEVMLMDEDKFLRHVRKLNKLSKDAGTISDYDFSEDERGEIEDAADFLAEFLVEA